MVDDFGAAQSFAEDATGFSDDLGAIAEQAGSSIVDVGEQMIADEGTSDFAADIIQSEVTEAVADDVWDDLDS